MDEIRPIIERDGEWFVTQCREVPGAIGQGKSVEECLENLREAVNLILEDRNSSHEGYRHR